MIKLNNLDKYYFKGKQNELHVVNNVSLELPDKGLVCILGESGSGKTTLMNIIGGIDDFKSGTIEAYGYSFSKSCNKDNEKIRNNNYSYIFQNYYLLGEQTVKDNIELVLNMLDITDEERESRINFVLEAVGMLKYKKRIISQLSGGQQQRVAIARALAKSPKVIFADEPTGNLDEANTMNVMSILKKISQECLVVLVTHEKRLANFFADRIINVSDGKIVSDVETKSDGKVYTYIDDANIYLKEYDKSAFEGDKVHADYYTNDEAKKFRINVVFENGKFYINSLDNSEIVLLDSSAESQIIDDYKPKVETEDVENIKYNLSHIEQKGLPRLNVKQIISLAVKNLKLLGKKQVFLVASLLIMSILMAITVQDIMTICHLDIKTLANCDSHCLHVTIKRGQSVSEDEFPALFEEVYDKFRGSGLEYDVFPSISRSLDFKYRGFEQIEAITSYINGFSFVSLDHLDKESVIYGRMPQKPNEIVVDKQVAEKFINHNKILSLVFNGPQSLLGKEFTMGKKLVAYEVVGICETNESSIYIDKFGLLGLVGWCNQPTSLSMLQANYPGQFDNIAFSGEETLTRNDTVMYGDRFNTGYFKFLTSVGKIPSDYPALFAINDSDYDRVLRDVVCYSKDFYVYTSNKSDIENYFKNVLSDEAKEKIQIDVEDKYTEIMTGYRHERSVKLNSRIIITLTIVTVCLLVLYYSMKSSAMKNIKNISVYRLLGIKKSSILLMYIFENIIISTYTSLVGVIVTSSVIKFLVSIPSLQMTIFYPWYAVIGVIAAIYIVNTIIGCIPITNIIKLPPAQIAAKYDM